MCRRNFVIHLTQLHLPGRELSMKRVLFLYLLLCASVVCSLSQTKDACDNPILSGFYPDPSIYRVGEDYYLVCSSFSYYPGIPIFHSKDLAHWNQIGHVLDRPEQLDLDGQGVSRGLFAPAIRYHEGIYYLTCTQVDKGGNFVVTSMNPLGPWSKPVWLPEINGIDPSPFFDDDGKSYILYNSIPPDNKPLYDGHRTIRMRRFDADSLKVSSEELLLVNGGVDISKKPVWIEGPHIFKVDGSYYLIAAEGGTAGQHSEVVFRSKNVTGPYVPYDKNPILTQRHLDPRRDFPVTSTGHADLVQTPAGSWWAVFLGCRPYRPFDRGYYNTGRETFLAPVVWKDGWPIINSDHEQIQFRFSVPIKVKAGSGGIPNSGKFVVRDEFKADRLDFYWTFLRTPRESWYGLSERKGMLTLKLRPQTCSEPTNPSFVGRRQQHLVGSGTVKLEFSPKSDHEKAGILIFQNEDHFYFLCKSSTGGAPIVQLFRSIAGDKSVSNMELIASKRLESSSGTKSVYLRIEARGETYAFLYSVRPAKWTLLKGGVDATFLSTRVAGGFVGSLYAMYATSLGAPSDNTAAFDWFEYAGNDERYKKR